jgi:hypothetical protein
MAYALFLNTCLLLLQLLRDQRNRKPLLESAVVEVPADDLKTGPARAIDFYPEILKPLCM